MCVLLVYRHTYSRNKQINKMKVNILASKTVNAVRFLSLLIYSIFIYACSVHRDLQPSCFACTPEMFGVLSADADLCK